MKLRLACPDDEVQLRKLARETQVPGQFTIIYAREPDYFQSLKSSGNNSQVIVAEDKGRLCGVGCRSSRQMLVNGQVITLGYLSGLRITKTARSSNVLARGYALLRELHQRDYLPAYLSSIIEDNHQAISLLTSRRAGLPAYLPLGSYLSWIFPLRREGLNEALAGKTTEIDIQISTAAEPSREEVSLFLQHHGSRRQFFPWISTAGENSLLDLIGLENILLAKKKGELLGVMGVWDQQQNRQYIIHSYSGLLGTARPLLNIALYLLRRSKLPAAGEQLRLVTAALCCVADDNSKVFQALFQAAQKKALQLGASYLGLGLHQRDPFLPSLKSELRFCYRSQLYLVSWEGDYFYKQLDSKLVPYFDLGAL